MRIIMINLTYHPYNKVKCPIGKLLVFFHTNKLGSQSVGLGSSAPIPDIHIFLNKMLKIILF